MDERLLILIVSYATARTDNTRRLAMAAIAQRPEMSGLNLGTVRERIDNLVQRASKVTYNEVQQPIFPR